MDSLWFGLAVASLVVLLGWWWRRRNDGAAKANAEVDRLDTLIGWPPEATRKRRIAQGAGVQVQDVNRLLNQYEQMRDMMKKMKGGGMMKMMKRMAGAKGMGGAGGMR